MRQQPKKNTFRLDKVNSYIQQEMGPILREFLAEEEGIITVSKVETSRDMKWAKIWISILGENDDKILGHLNKNIYEIQGRLNEKFSTKVIPRISFYLDTSPRYAEHIDELIRKVHSENNN